MSESLKTGTLQAVLFDLDGTLIDSHDLILSSFRHATRTVLGRVIPDEELMQKVGQPLSTQMWDWTSDPAVHEELLQVYRAHNHAVHDDIVRGFQGVPESLAALQAKGLRMGVVTSKLHQLANRGLTVTGIADYMEILVGADDYPDAHKPDPGPVRFACERLGLPPEACWYVGDSPFDIAAGNAAGCPTIAVTWGMFPVERLAAENPTVICTTPEEMTAALI